MLVQKKYHQDFIDVSIQAEFVVRIRNKIISVERKISASHFSGPQIGKLLKLNMRELRDVSSLAHF